MAATDGDSRRTIDRSAGQPWNEDDTREEVHAVDVATGSGGAGSSTVTWDTEFDGGEVYVTGTPNADARVFASAAGASQATIEVAGGPANSTVTVYVRATGPSAR